MLLCFGELASLGGTLITQSLYLGSYGLVHEDFYSWETNYLFLQMQDSFVLGPGVLRSIQSRGMHSGLQLPDLFFLLGHLKNGCFSIPCSLI
jgi:hypothetical protein